MVSLSQVLTYALVVFIGAIAPGADFAVVSRHATLSGRRAGIAAAAGIAGGLMVNATAALLGMAAVLLASPLLYAIIKLIGAAYLVYLGLTVLWSIRPRRRKAVEAVEAVEEGAASPIQPPTDEVAGVDGPIAVRSEVAVVSTPFVAFRQAFLTNLLNPKPIIFLVTLIPQFLPDHPNVLSRVILDVVTAGAAFTWFCIVALVFSAFARFFAIPKVAITIAAITGLMLLSIGVGFAISTIVGNSAL